MRIHFAFISEGPSEEPLVAHLAALCLEAGAIEVDGYWVDFRRLPEPPGHRVEDQVQWVAEHAPSINLLFIHRDADKLDDNPRRAQISAAVATSDLAPPYVAVVPIQELEAWLLLDEMAIRRVAGNPAGRAPLNLPKPKHIEARARPKEILKQALETAQKRNRRQPSFFEARRILLERLDLDGPIDQLSSWSRLRADIRAVIHALD